MDATVAALIGVGVGSVTGLGSQYFASWLTEKREQKVKKGREERVQAAFTAMLVSLHELLYLQTSNGVIWDETAFERELAPIQALVAQPNILLDLNPERISAILKLLSTTRINITFMPSLIRQYEREEQAATDGDAKGAARERLIRVLQNTFASSEGQCRHARVMFGEQEPLKAHASPNL